MDIIAFQRHYDDIHVLVVEPKMDIFLKVHIIVQRVVYNTCNWIFDGYQQYGFLFWIVKNQYKFYCVCIRCETADKHTLSKHKRTASAETEWCSSLFLRSFHFSTQYFNKLSKVETGFWFEILPSKQLIYHIIHRDYYTYNSLGQLVRVQYKNELCIGAIDNVQIFFKHGK